MTIMIVGGMTVAFPGAMPEAMAANANLFVSAENSQFNNRISGPQVIEVVVIDNNINTLDDNLGEPDVTVNGKKLRMAQATDGNWYAYFAEVEQAQLADSTNTGSGTINGVGLDFGTFCDNSNAALLLGFSVSETKGIAMNNNNGVNGTTTAVTNIATNADCDNVDATNTNGTINVVREYKDLNVNSSVDVGQIGFSSTYYPKTNAAAADQFGSGAKVHNTNAVWPFIQLYDFTVGGDVKVTYNKGGGAQTATFTFDESENITTTLDRSIYPLDADVHIEIADNWLNIDPTDEDSWTFDADPSAPKTYYAYYDEDGNDLTGTPKDISSSLTVLLNSDAKLTIDADANGGTAIIDFSGNDNNGSTTGDDKVTFLESGVNTGIFTSYDSDDESGIEIKSDAARGKSAVITYDDSSSSIVVGNSFGILDISIDDDEWNSGETATVTLTDNDLNKNSRSDEDLAVSNQATRLIPTLVTGNPFTLGETVTNFSTTNTDYVSQSQGSIAAVSTALEDYDITGSATKTAELTVSKYSHIGYIDADTTTTDTLLLLVPTGATVADLKSSINTNSTSNFYGKNLFAWNVESINSTATYKFYMVNGTTVLGTDENDSILRLAAGSAQDPKGIAEITKASLDAINEIEDTSDSVSILVEIQAQGTDININTVYPVTFDFLTFGFSNDGEDSADRTSNQIIRLELEETGDNTGVLVGSLEYVMINQLNIQDATTFTGLSVVSDEATFIAFEDLTDEDSPRVNYLDLGSDGVETQIADQLAAPSHSGVVYFDSESYKVADTVTITLEDPDLNTDVDLIDIFTTVRYQDAGALASDGDRDQVGKDTFYSDFSFGSLGRLLDVTFDDDRWQYDSASACSSLDTLASVGFTLVETGRDTGIFTGNFQIPSNYCTSSSASASTTGVDIEVNYVDFRDASGEIIEVGDSAAVRANTGSITLDRTVYPVPLV
jgi:hypothetical protein